jgi:chemotaxis regulatin CheY-phosphate phosphatase CheZ
VIDGVKTKALGLLDITVPFARTLEDQSESLRNKWTAKLMKENTLQSAIFSSL